jgi:hypothetical protein
VADFERRLETEIDTAYEAASRDAEILLLMLKQAELDEEDAVVALLLTL